MERDSDKFARDGLEVLLRQEVGQGTTKDFYAIPEVVSVMETAVFIDLFYYLRTSGKELQEKYFRGTLADMGEARVRSALDEVNACK